MLTRPRTSSGVRMELRHLVVGDTLGSWGQSFVTAPINLTYTSFSYVWVPEIFFS